MEGEGKPSKLDGQVEARPPPVHQHSSDSISSIDRNTTPATQQHSTDDMEKAARTAMILEEDLQLEGGFMSFPEKLMSLLEGGELRESMWWLPEGDAFCLVPENFDSILNSHFQGTKFESFTRKLNRWYVSRSVCSPVFKFRMWLTIHFVLRFGTGGSRE